MTTEQKIIKTKVGVLEWSKAFFMLAMVVIRFHPVIKAFATRLREPANRTCSSSAQP